MLTRPKWAAKRLTNHRAVAISGRAGLSSESRGAVSGAGVAGDLYGLVITAFARYGLLASVRPATCFSLALSGSRTAPNHHENYSRVTARIFVFHRCDLDRLDYPHRQQIREQEAQSSGNDGKTEPLRDAVVLGADGLTLCCCLRGRVHLSFSIHWYCSFQQIRSRVAPPSHLTRSLILDSPGFTE